MTARVSRDTAGATIRVGTRGSELALRQTGIVIEALRQARPDLDFSTTVIRTQGDESLNTDLSQFASQGVFVHRIEAALLAREIDLAVHSAKDMPTASPPGLTTAAYLRREDPRDALVSRGATRLADLRSGAIVGTGSPRRQALLQAARPDICPRAIRGNVDTRLRRVAAGDLDAVVVAAAGMLRLERQAEIAELLDPSQFIPAVGQGIIAVQTREDDRRVRKLVSQLEGPATRACALAERAVAVAIGAGCQTPFGAYAYIDADALHLAAFLALEGQRGVLREGGACATDEGAAFGGEIGRRLLAASTERGAR